MFKIRLIYIVFLVIICVMISFEYSKAIDSNQVQIEAVVPELSEELSAESSTNFLNSSGIIKKFYAKNQLYEYKNLVFYTQFQNTGEQSLKPTGHIIIKNWFGKEIERLPFNDYGIMVPTGNSNTYQTIWIPKNILGAGKYSASLIVNYGTSENIISQIHFWIFPWKVAGISLSFLILLFLIHAGIELLPKYYILPSIKSIKH